jgi:predicted amidophosphoribosyltransferase
VATVVASERLHRAVEPGDALVPIPLAGRRRRVRGYNQAEVIARSLEGLLAGSPGHRSPGPSRAAPHPSPGTPAAMVEHGLVRTRETASQVGRHRGERALNVDNAFAWRGPSLAGRRVWLVDDVVTTGATAASAARALAATRPSRIGVIALARA